jgi:hypothetical protein
MSTTLADALVAAAAAENAAVYGYAAAGARLLSGTARASARAAYDLHRAQVHTVAGWLASHGATPSPPAAVYELPHPVTDANSAVALLALLEEGSAAAYADVVAAAADEALRRAAALALQSAAVREARWQGAAVPFPGLVGRLPT